MVGEPFEESGQQRHIDGFAHRVGSDGALDRGQDFAVQRVELVVAALLLGEVFANRVGDDLLHPVGGEGGQAAQVGELAS